MPIRDALLPEFDQEMATTRKVLERCPAEKFSWKPHPKSWDTASLATHIANMPGWAAETMNRQSLDIAPPGAPAYREEPARTHAELLERFDKNVAAARAAIAGATDERMLENWTLLSGGNPIFTLPRIAVLRSMILNHGIHHRGQLSVYLRLNDVPVPSIYGPTADEPGV